MRELKDKYQRGMGRKELRPERPAWIYLVRPGQSGRGAGATADDQPHQRFANEMEEQNRTSPEEFNLNHQIFRRFLGLGQRS